MTPRAMLPGVDELFGSAKPKEGEQVLVPLDRLGVNPLQFALH